MKNRIHFLIINLVIFSLFFSSCSKSEETVSTVPYSETGYYLQDEYLKRYPEQVSILNSFNKLVQNKSETISRGIQKEPVKISMIYPGSEKSDYWRRSISSFSNRMDEIGIEYTINDYFTRPGSIDKKLQEEQIYEALNNDPDYLVFTLDVTRHKEIIERIITTGKPKLILQNITTPIKEWDNNQPFLYVGFSHRLGTRQILIPEYLKRTEGEGSYAMLYFSKGFVSEQRGDSFIQYMEQNSNLQLKVAYYTDGQYNRAKRATEDILIEYPDIKFIYACSTSIALAAVEVLQANNVKDKVLVNGWGGGSAELDSIMERNLDFTVMRINDDNGIAMAEAVKLDLQGMSNKVPTVYSGDFVLVKQETSNNELNILKKRAFRYSGTDE